MIPIIEGRQGVVSHAAVFAIGAHEALAQKRKYTGEPYWHHCKRVAETAFSHRDNVEGENLEAMLASAWLHDVVEDTDVSLDVISAIFGDRVEGMVDALTKIERRSNQSREEHNLFLAERLGRFGDPVCQKVKCADILDNLSNLEALHCRHVKGGPSGLYIGKYAEEKKMFLEHMTIKETSIHRLSVDLCSSLLTRFGR